MKTIRFKQWNCLVDTTGEYQDGSKAIELIDQEDGSPVMVASVWVPGLEEGEVAIKHYSENEGILDVLIEEGIVTKPHRKVHSGFVTIPVCKFVE